MQFPEPRGPLSLAVRCDLADGTSLSATTLAVAERAAATSADPLVDDDLQVALAICYELHYRGFDGVPDSWEWDPDLLRLRALLEHRHTEALRALVGPVDAPDEPIDRQLPALIAADDSPSLSSYLARHGTLEQWREYLTVRSVYHLKEGDPHTFAIPRLSGRTKAAMVEIQADEYGGGAPPRKHNRVFSRPMAAPRPHPASRAPPGDAPPHPVS